MSRSFLKNRSALIVLVSTGLLVVAGFASRSALGEQFGKGVQRMSWWVLGPVLEIGTNAGANLKNVSGYEEANANAAHELAGLRAEVAVLKTRLAELETLEALNAQLPVYSSSVIALKNLGPVSDPKRQVLWVKVAEGADIREGQTLIGSQGYLGRVEELNGGYCTVQLLTDETSQVGARNERSQELGVVRFNEALNAVIFQPGSSAPILAVGDKIVTSGLRGSTILEGLPLGTVVELTTDRQGERVAVLALAQESTTEPLAFALHSTTTDWSAKP
jgi:cell shape-determining protein MreC